MPERGILRPPIVVGARHPGVPAIAPTAIFFKHSSKSSDAAADCASHLSSSFSQSLSLFFRKSFCGEQLFRCANNEKDQERCQTLLAIDDRHDSGRKLALNLWFNGCVSGVVNRDHGAENEIALGWTKFVDAVDKSSNNRWIWSCSRRRDVGRPGCRSIGLARQKILKLVGLASKRHLRPYGL